MAFLVLASFFAGAQIFIATESSSKPRYSSRCVGSKQDFSVSTRAKIREARLHCVHGLLARLLVVCQNENVVDVDE